MQTTITIDPSLLYSSYKDVISRLQDIIENASIITIAYEGLRDQNLFKANLITQKIVKQAGSKPVISIYEDETYLLNRLSTIPRIIRQTEINIDNNAIENVYNTLGDDGFRKQQQIIYQKLKHIMPLLSQKDYENNPPHLEKLTAANRGLTPKDVKDFLSWKKDTVLNPALLQTNFYGIAGLSLRTVSLSHNGELINCKQITTLGPTGILLPMPDVDGVIRRYHVYTDLTPYNTILKCRAKDGITVAHSEVFKEGAYIFKRQGLDAMLQINKTKESVTGQNLVELRDKWNLFRVYEKSEIAAPLRNNGYDIPEIIDTITVVNDQKYSWQVKGSFVGTGLLTERICPNDPGFLISKKPEGTSNAYDLVIVEGVLKGHIVSKYLNASHPNGGPVLGRVMSKDRGIIIACVPGVAKSFIDRVKPIYEQYNINGTYIAMDMDGKTNITVTRGIHHAETELAAYNNTNKQGDHLIKVMSWNEDYKGLDDLLIAYARGLISPVNVNLRFNTAQSLFPMEEAVLNYPYALDGSRFDSFSYQRDFQEQQNLRHENLIRQLQEKQNSLTR